jgi:hypothetical protein
MIATATERYKMLLANAWEQVCILGEQLDIAREKIKQLEKGGETMTEEPQNPAEVVPTIQDQPVDHPADQPQPPQVPEEQQPAPDTQAPPTQPSE